MEAGRGMGMTGAAEHLVAKDLLHTCAQIPQAYRTPDARPTLAEAQAYCKHLAESHYENFHVATWFLPKRLRPHFQSIYAYCRIADDLGDEVADPELATRLLDEWGRLLDECYDAPRSSLHPVFVALAETVRACSIPRKPFADLLVAFRMDQTVTRYATLQQLEDYSEYSANPVGHLVLYAAGYDDAEMRSLADKTCTGLQLANMWQDVHEDYERGRVYLSAAAMERHGVAEAQIAQRDFTPQFRELMRELVDYTRTMLREGSALNAKVDAELATTLSLFTRGGLAILDAIEAQDYNVLARRPVVSKAAKAKLLLGALAGKFLPQGKRIGGNRP